MPSSLNVLIVRSVEIDVKIVQVGGQTEQFQGLEVHEISRQAI